MIAIGQDPECVGPKVEMFGGRLKMEAKSISKDNSKDDSREVCRRSSWMLNNVPCFKTVL